MFCECKINNFLWLNGLYFHHLWKKTSFFLWLNKHHLFEIYIFDSDIRGIAVGGVEGEPVNLTEPVAESIAAAFAAWLMDKKKVDGSKRLRVSIGHDSRISAQTMQVC